MWIKAIPQSIKPSLDILISPDQLTDIYKKKCSLHKPGWCHW